MTCSEKFLQILMIRSIQQILLIKPRHCSVETFEGQLETQVEATLKVLIREYVHDLYITRFIHN